MSSCCYCCGGVVTQAYGQPDNPVSHWKKMKNPAILTAAPFRGLPQPEAHYRSGLTTKPVRNGPA
ncbi:hypothetical protein R537_09645 [Salmonella enterica subsp. enterica serovar Rough O:d:1,7]|uniref:Uncharacterized protein n=1 Tax=Salmonella enterica subsp. enterica serovar Rough O:d:1,7 TaxID=1974323 RepID=A0A974KIE9_SALET|nr:hypothetical protein R537_09645 [Salmonella enterica subsp. enterica serovar Rough O:d:1,7]